MGWVLEHNLQQAAQKTVELEKAEHMQELVLKQQAEAFNSKP